MNVIRLQVAGRPRLAHAIPGNGLPKAHAHAQAL